MIHRLLRVVFLLLLAVILPVNALALTAEMEPNGHISSANLILPGDTIAGTLDGTDVDVFLLPSGQDLRILCRADAAEVRFTVQHGSGKVLAESISGGYVDGAFVDEANTALSEDPVFLVVVSEHQVLTNYTLFVTAPEVHTHSYIQTVTPPACETDGFLTFRCGCGESYTTTGQAALGHSFGLWVTVREPTQTSPGLRIRTCKVCGKEEQTNIDVLAGEDRNHPFADVDGEAYYAMSVLWAFRHGITTGTDATHFSPDQPCTRAQIVTFLWRALGEPAPQKTASPFLDVAENAYYYRAVLWAAEQGITKGRTETAFEPGVTCTRAQAVTFLWRAMGCPEANSEALSFLDVQPGSYFAPAVAWAVEKEITTGKTADTFAPNGACKRCQIVTFLYRTLGEK